MKKIRCLSGLLLLLAVALVGCGPSQAERQAAAQAAAAAAAAATEREAAQQQALFQQNLSSGNIEMAAAYAELIMGRYPNSAAAKAIAPDFEKIKQQAAAIKEQRRLESLWDYQTSAVGGGTQRTATLYSEDADAPRVQLVLRRHTSWGLSVFLLPASDIFRCNRCSGQLRVDEGASRAVALTKSSSKENPALFIDDEAAFLKALGTGQLLLLEVPVAGGSRKLRFEIGGYQPARFSAPQ